MFATATSSRVASAASGSPGPRGAGPPSAAAIGGVAGPDRRALVPVHEVLDDAVDDEVAEAAHRLRLEAERVGGADLLRRSWRSSIGNVAGAPGSRRRRAPMLPP